MVVVKSTIKELELRGYVNKAEIVNTSRINKTSLKKQLMSQIPTDRTTAVLIIKKNNGLELIPNLIDALILESKLYCKIAISESLIEFKEKSVKMLIPCLGTIGKNRHYDLPIKPFKKDSYALPRDIVARILVNIGISVIPDLINNCKTLSRIQILEAIDVLGHISFYTKEKSSLAQLLKLYNDNKDDNVMRWKLLRSFSAFDDDAVKMILSNTIKESSIKAHIWEAKRSIRLIEHRIAAN